MDTGRTEFPARSEENRMKVAQHARSYQKTNQAGTYQERQETKLRGKAAYQDI